MKNIVWILTMLPFGLQAQIGAYFSQCSFNTPENKAYVETYLSVVGNSVQYKKNANGKFQAQVEVGILFSQNGAIKASRKLMLMSPELADTANKPNFMDVQRISLEPGEYEFEQMVTDKVANGKTLTARRKLVVDYPAGKVNVSDIELLESYAKAESPGPMTKNGIDLKPYMADFYYPADVKELQFYAEIYNSKAVLGENEKFVVNSFLEGYEQRNPILQFSSMKKETTATVNVLLSKFNIEQLPSGNYNLVVEVRNKSNEVVAFKKVFFQRSNKGAKVTADILAGVTVENTFASRMNSRDTLAEFLRCLRPICSESEKLFLDNQLKAADVKLMQQFFYTFWKNRSAHAPEEAWRKYHADVQAVNAKFSTFNYKGYETDRGRVYLQYGPPDKREESPSEPNAYPYEIWIYYKLEDKSRLNPNQTNKQFIFYNPEISTNNYRILHSDALGETKDSRWEMKLHKRTVQSHDFEKRDAPQHFGGNSSEMFSNPR